MTPHYTISIERTYVTVQADVVQDVGDFLRIILTVFVLIHGTGLQPPMRMAP